jgi:N utilization substance protein A
MPSPIYQAIKQICNEKNIPVESVIETIEAALAAAYRKDFGQKNQNIKVEFNAETGESRVFDVKTVVPDELAILEEERKKEAEEAKALGLKVPKPEVEKEEEKEEVLRFNPKLHLPLSEALKIKSDAKLGEVIRTELEIPHAFGRMAAQTAKQVIIQKLREAEREILFNEFKAKEGQLLPGVVQRREGVLVLVDLGRLTAILPPEEQIEREKYIPGSHLKVYVLKVEMAAKGPQVIVSRAHPEILRELFSLEIPEVSSGVVEIKAIAREAGNRSKVAVFTKEENIDPIGSCIGQRGTRIQTIINELGGEKIDVIEWNEDAAEFVKNALSPAKILNLEIKEGEKTALATVKSDQLSLAIGKGGQNVRLAAKLTGWKINIREEEKEEIKEVKEGEKVEEKKVEEGEAEKVLEKAEGEVEEKKKEKKGAEEKKEEVKEKKEKKEIKEKSKSEKK